MMNTDSVFASSQGFTITNSNARARERILNLIKTQYMVCGMHQQAILICHANFVEQMSVACYSFTTSQPVPPPFFFFFFGLQRLLQTVSLDASTISPAISVEVVASCPNK